MPLCFLTISLTVSIELSKCLSSFKINFYLFSASIVTVSYWECCKMWTDTNCTASGTVTCFSCAPRLPVIANKTNLRLSDRCPDVSVCHVIRSQRTDCTPHCSSHIYSKQMHDCSYVWPFPTQLLSVFWCMWLHGMQYEVSFGTYMAHRPINFKISNFLRLGELRKIFQATSGPTTGISSFQVLQNLF